MSDGLHLDDFTFTHYEELIDLAKRHYRFISYPEAMAASDRRILWRHDVDLSVHRAVKMARLEASLGVCTTYFLNPHSEFYSLLEPEVSRRVAEIVSLGHNIGLHFDANASAVTAEEALGPQVAREAGWLTDWLGVEVRVFSFHNPTTNVASWEGATYGGLINCYSAGLAKSFGYCSDSNGYWRHRRLADVLTEACEPNLQVLTHPGWWQDQTMSPRARVFRSSQGRARNTLDGYDAFVRRHGRANPAGSAAALTVLASLDPDRFAACDYLWNTGRFAPLFLELWRAVQTLPAGETPVAAPAALSRWRSLATALLDGDRDPGAAELEKQCVELCALLERYSPPTS